MAEAIVVKLEQYPLTEPQGWVVGFNVVCNNGRSFYIETVIDFNKATTDEVAVEVALEELKETIQNKVSELENKPSILGKRFAL
jgi:hypothetical protein